MTITVHVGPLAYSQQWASAELVSGPANEWITEVASTGNFTAIAGSFQGETVISGEVLQSKGGFDIFVALYDADGTLLWVRSVGGTGLDNPSALSVSESGDVLLGGEYTGQLELQDTALVPAIGSTGAFAVIFNLESHVQTIAQMSGTGLERVAATEFLSDGDFVVAGYFSDSLRLADTVVAASSDPAAFLSVFHKSGTVASVHIIGESGNARASALAVTPTGKQIVMAGNYQGTVAFAGVTLTASASGTDLFLLSIDTEGNPLWMTGAKGAWDDQVTALCTDASDAVYMTGYLVGNLVVSDEIALQSADFSEDIFVAKYFSDGHLVWAKSFADAGEETGEAIAVREGHLVILSRYQERFSTGGQTIISPSSFEQSALIEIDTAGTFQQLVPIHSSDLCLAEDVAASSSGYVVVGGFTGEIQLPPFTLQSVGGFDGFRSLLGEQATAAAPGLVWQPSQRVTVWPNPAVVSVNFEWPEALESWCLTDLSGQRLPLPEQPADLLEISHLTPGIYLLTATGQSGVLYQCRIVLVNR